MHASLWRWKQWAVFSRPIQHLKLETGQPKFPNGTMLYGRHVAFLDREIHLLGGAGFALSFTEIDGILATRNSKETDAICKQFAQTLHWPELSEKTRFEICLRLSCARSWCLHLGDCDSEDQTGQEFLESILVEYWNDVGREDWIYDRYVKLPCESGE